MKRYLLDNELLVGGRFAGQVDIPERALTDEFYCFLSKLIIELFVLKFILTLQLQEVVHVFIIE